jgi:flagellar biogenesis protein FliO
MISFDRSASKWPERLGRALVLALAVMPCAAYAEKPNSPSFEATAEGRQRILPHPKIGKSAASPSTSDKNSATGSSAGWWLGTAGIAVALAIFGGVSVAAKKLQPTGELQKLKVVGKTSLSSKHSVYLLKAGDRVLIVGTGPQGSPTLLGELDPDEAKPAVSETPKTRMSIPTFPKIRVGGGV